MGIAFFVFTASYGDDEEKVGILMQTSDKKNTK
uniref:Uncharacterized protein n=1 Tax=Arundo donax TaxID=35708 RepID=A0A0A9B0G7_ARUDO